MNDLIVIPEERIEIIIEDIPETHVTNQIINLRFLRIFLISLVCLFVVVMVLWLFDAFSPNIQTYLNYMYVSMIIAAIIVKAAKLF